MLCEVCSQYKGHCIIYKKSIQEALLLCSKDKYKRSTISPILLSELLDEYNNRISDLERIIGRIKLNF